MAPKKIAIITGGDSPEARSSYNSAREVFDQLSPERYKRYMVEVARWKWRLLDADDLSPAALQEAVFDPACFAFNLTRSSQNLQFNCAFIVLHGTPGETGHIQAYLDMINLPYTGSGMLSSAMTMDKHVCKTFLHGAMNIPAPRHYITTKYEELEPERLEKELSYPLVVKPNSSGSGIAVAVVFDRVGLKHAVEQASRIANAVMVEEFINGMEVTVGAVRTKDNEIALPVAEIIRPGDGCPKNSSNGNILFTDRQHLEKIIPARLDPGTTANLQKLTLQIGEALHCRGLFRVDYMVDALAKPYFLELNSVPGLAPNSVFTQQLAAMGISAGDIFAMVIEDVLG